MCVDIRTLDGEERKASAQRVAENAVCGDGAGAVVGAVDVDYVESGGGLWKAEELAGVVALTSVW